MTNWILLRGLSRETRHWGEFPNILAQKNPKSKIIVLELPGVGKKNHLGSPKKIEDFVESLRPDFLSIKNKEQNEKTNEWGIISISLGGMIALNWAEKYPDDFSKIVTINTSASDLSNPIQRIGLKAISKMAKLFIKNDLIEREREILELTTSMTEVDDNLVKKWASYSKEYPLSRKAFLNQLYAASKFKAPKKIDLPCLIIVGEKDQLANPKCSIALAKHFKLPYYSHPHAGHDLPLDDPEWLVNQIYQWERRP